MKAWAKAYDINSSKDGTLNSLSLVLLVAFHLQVPSCFILGICIFDCPPVSTSCLRGNFMDRNIHCTICRSKLEMEKLNAVA